MRDFILKVWNLFCNMLPSIDVDKSDNSFSVEVLPSRLALEAMTKKEIDEMALDNYGIYLDSRKKKSVMIDQLFEEFSK